MMDVRSKRVLVVGLARSGRAAARILSRKGAEVMVTDSRPPSNFQAEIRELAALKVGLELGLHREETFLNQDLIVVSPGVSAELPYLKSARQRKIPIIPEIELASWYLRGSLVGITGSNGKTTTTTLLGRMLESSGFPTFVGGNIGVPLISAVEQARGDSLLVAELSSFQLEAIQSFRPHVAVLLNLSPNHLDRHSSFDAYVGAKSRIFHNQTAEDYAILNADDPNVMNLAPAIASRKIYFSRRQNLADGVFVSNGHILYRAGNLERVLLERSDVRLRGDFNVDDVLAASAAACVVGADFDAVRRSVREFKGVEHRLEFVREIHHVEFYNDSKATSVDAAAKALTAFERGVHLILGGKDKGAPYTPLRPLFKGRVREVLLIGAAAEKIAKDIQGSVEIIRVGDIETAVRHAFSKAGPGDVVLLAPACASYDQFQNFEHRGRVFKELVERLAQESAITDSVKQEEIMNLEPAAPVNMPAEAREQKSDQVIDKTMESAQDPAPSVFAPTREQPTAPPESEIPTAGYRGPAAARPAQEEKLATKETAAVREEMRLESRPAQQQNEVPGAKEIAAGEDRFPTIGAHFQDERIAFVEEVPAQNEAPLEPGHGQEPATPALGENVVTGADDPAPQHHPAQERAVESIELEKETAVTENGIPAESGHLKEAAASAEEMPPQIAPASEGGPKAEEMPRLTDTQPTPAPEAKQQPEAAPAEASAVVSVQGVSAAALDPESKGRIPELHYVYEVAAEEFAPLSDELWAKFSGEGSEDVVPAELAPPENILEKLLPFEVPTVIVAAGSEAADQPKRGITPSLSGKEQSLLFEDTKNPDQVPKA